MKDIMTVAIRQVEKYRFALDLSYESEDLNKIGNLFQAVKMLLKGEAEVKFPSSN